MAKLISVVNMKGGVGKTATVVSVAETFAARGGGPILIIDVDTQATASYCLAGNTTLTHAITEGRTVDAFLRQRLAGAEPGAGIRHFIRAQATATRHDQQPLQVSLLPSSTALRASEREIVRQLTTQRLSMIEIEHKIATELRRALAEISTQYTYIIVDCAPGISPFTTAAIGLADLIIVPTIPDAPSVLGLAAFLDHVRTESTYHAAQRAPHVLLTRYAPRRIRAWFPSRRANAIVDHHREYRNRLEELANSDTSFKLMSSIIEETPLMPHAMGLGGVAPTYGQKYPGRLGRMLEQLTNEIEEVLK